MGNPGIDKWDLSKDDSESDYLEGIGDLGAAALVGRVHGVLRGVLFSSLFLRFTVVYSYLLSQWEAWPPGMTLVNSHTLVAAEIQRWASGSTVTFEVEKFRSQVGDALHFGPFVDFGGATCVACGVPFVVFTMAGILMNKSYDAANVNSKYGRKRQYGIMRTFLCCFSLYLGVMVAGGLIMYAASCSSSFVNVLFVSALTSLLDGVLILGLLFAFQLVFAVAFLEDIHGWKALGKSWRLLQGKKWVGFQILCLNVVQICLTIIIWHWTLARFHTTYGEQPASRSPASYAWGVVYWLGVLMADGFSGSMSFFFFLGTETALYFSCKALHQETVSNLDLFESKVTDPEQAYEQIPEPDSPESLIA